MKENIKKNKYYKVTYMENSMIYERFFISMVEAYNFYKNLKSNYKTIYPVLISRYYNTNVDYIPLFQV